MQGLETEPSTEVDPWSRIEDPVSMQWAVDLGYAYGQLEEQAAWLDLTDSLKRLRKIHVDMLIAAQGNAAEHRVKIELMDRILAMPALAKDVAQQCHEALGSMDEPEEELSHA